MIEKQIAKRDSDLENADNTKAFLQVGETVSKDDLSTLVSIHVSSTTLYGSDPRL